MITTAVIMAAGMGTRFGSHTEEKPKGFVNVGGSPMIIRAIQALLKCGIKRIIIGTGYKKETYEALKAVYPQIETFENEQYATTNSMFTLFTLRSLIGDDDFLLLESDLVFEEKAIEELLKSSYADEMLISPVIKFQDQYFVEADARGYLIKCSTDETKLKPAGELVGIHKISNKFYSEMCEDYAKTVSDNLTLGYEFQLEKISKDKHRMHVLKIDGLKWYEIDDQSDLEYAEKNILPFLYNSSPSKKNVYLGMTADVMHPGLVNIINEAGKYGEVLIGLLTDKAVATHKRLPALTYEQRKQVVESIKNVSRVVPQEEWSYVENLKKYRPDYIIHGDDWKNTDPTIRKDVFKVMEEIGGRVIEVPYTKGVSSSDLEAAANAIGITPAIRQKRLRRLIVAKPIVRILESHSGLTGLIVENISVDVNGKKEEFDGMWASSLTDSTSKGKPDIEAVDLTTRLHGLNDALECTTKPVIYDGDTGGKIEHFVFTVRTLERLGVSAVIIEDKVGLKKNSLFGTDAIQTQDSIEGFCEKIRAGKRAQIAADFMIIARIESLIAGKPLADALERAFAYVEAGADGVMIHSKDKSGEDIKSFCQKFREKYSDVPIVVVPTTYNQITEEELAAWGVNVVIYANHMLRSAYPAMVNAAKAILAHHRSLEANPLCMPIKEILELIPGTK